MPIGIFIPADDSVELTEREFSSLHDFQTAIGGYIETVDLVEPPFAVSTLFINEEGKFLPEPPNKRATLLLWLHQPALRFQDEIVGDAILMGKPKASGTAADVPTRLRRLLLEAQRLVIEMISINADETKQVHRTGLFRTWVNAYVVAVDIQEAMPDGTKVRVVSE